MDKLIPLFPKINKLNYDVANHLTKNTFSKPSPSSNISSNSICPFICLFITKGPKLFAWFTYYNNKPICLFYNQDQEKIVTHYVCFKEELSLGTILYGTLIDNNFVCETIYLHKNENIGGNFINKLNIIKDILKLSIKDSNDNQSISFKLPQMSNSTKVVLECSNLPYQVYGILQIDSRPKMIILSHLFGNFNIKKDPLEDVYNLYALNDNELVLYSTALVNDFKTSHFLKKLFSIKKDYKNIEFSDDEDSEPISKNLIYVSCIYIHEFKKWKPYVLKKGDADSTKTIQFKEKKNIAL
jgi:hypothetical protein